MAGSPTHDRLTLHSPVLTTARFGTIVCGVKLRVDASGTAPIPFQTVRLPEAAGSTAVTLTATACTSRLLIPLKLIGSMTVDQAGTAPPKDGTRVSSSRVGVPGNRYPPLISVLSVT